MTVAYSPLRYPGGKQVLAGVLSHLMRFNRAHGGTYVEPFAGGAGAAIALLFGEHVERVIINDADPAIYALWHSMLHNTNRFVRLVDTTRLSVREWERQREVYLHPSRQSMLKLGFATFYLNRCNRSGIIKNGGPIGGKRQTGRWKIGARFTRDTLTARIRRIADFKDRIELRQLDGLDLLANVVSKLPSRARPFVYLDPPYFDKGPELYLNHYGPTEHSRLASFLERGPAFKWVLSYDNVEPIRKLYRGMRQVPFDLKYSARERRKGKELLITAPDFVFPEGWHRRIPRAFLTTAPSAMGTD